MILGVLKITFVLFFISLTAIANPIKMQFAEIQVLNKITAKVNTLFIQINNSIKFDTLEIEIFSCLMNSPNEIPENYVLLKIFDYNNVDEDKLIYQGWMISSSPAITPLEHPIYDLWLKNCKIDIDS